MFPWAAQGPELGELLAEVWEVPAPPSPDCLDPPEAIGTMFFQVI